MSLTLKKVEDMAKKYLEEHRSHKIQMFIEVNGKIEMYMLIFRDDDEKNNIVDGMRKMVSLRKIDSYFVAFEAWLSKRKPLEKHIRPKDDPNKEEVLIVSNFKRDNTGEKQNERKKNEKRINEISKNFV